LTLRGEKHTNDEEKSGDVLYQGIAARNFERSFQLADHVQVKGASLQNGGTNLLRGGRRMHLASGPPPVT
jgi:HSP20 family molecular chaperone IbpA